MKRIPKLAGLTLCALAAAGLALALQLPQGASAQAQACSLETLQGDYIYSYDGVTVADGQQTPYAYAGRENYDGQGGMTGVYSGSYGGEAARSVVVFES